MYSSTVDNTDMSSGVKEEDRSCALLLYNLAALDDYTQHTQDINPFLAQCRPTVYDAWPA